MISAQHHHGQHKSLSQDIPLYHHYQESIEYNTVDTNCLVGIYFLLHHKGWINVERMASSQDFHWVAPMGKSLVWRYEQPILTLSRPIGLEWWISWSIPKDGLMMRECLYSIKSQEVLRNPSHPPSRFPSTLQIGGARIQYIPPLGGVCIQSQCKQILM